MSESSKKAEVRVTADGNMDASRRTHASELDETIKAILAPLRQEFADSGTTEEQLIQQIEEAREQSYAARQQRMRHP